MSTNEEKNYRGSFLIGPLEIGHGITLGNAIRRTLLSDLTSFSITGVRINNLKHEFSGVEGLREDVLEVLLNLKEIIFKNSFKLEKEILPLKGFLKAKGPIVVTAGMFQLPRNSFKIINPTQYICTIVDKSELNIEIDLENGKGYRLIEEIQGKKMKEKFLVSKPSTLLVDALFMPIKKVNYKINLNYDSHGNIKEFLTLEITTNGSSTPKHSLYEALKILMNLFYPLFINFQFSAISSSLIKRKT